MSIAPVDSW